MSHTVVGVDLAKEMTPNDLSLWLATHHTSIVVFEACATSNYWKQKALKCGYDAKLISAKLVANIRQNQKIDKNDALAIVQACQWVDIRFIRGKTSVYL